MAVINTNIASLNAQNNLNKSSSNLQTSLQRLSSGLRINSAKDDAAGLAISNRMTSQINGLNVAVRNANDGISLAQTAEGAMQESTNILQRMRELSLQSANGSNGADDRAALQAEVTQLQAELTRISDTTSFNGQKLFDGTFGTRSFQIGSEANETVDLTIEDIGADQLGVVSGKTLDKAGYNADNLGVAAETLTFDVTDANGTYSIDVDLELGAGNTDLINAINDNVGSYGILATDDGAGGFTLSANNEVTAVTITSDIAADAGTFATAGSAQAVGAADSSVTGSAINSVNISTANGAQDAISSIDAAIKEIDAKRADLGAFQNRMDSTISNLTNVAENVSAARSRIMDADFAAETANLTKNQILQQAGTAMLAQANTLPQGVLSLLQ
ncbi:flagellin [Amphritea atlantica]|uniref:Flagellin n=1 Tax=Amphritea atlantica TaxID=355243 RepID=A0ABY5GS42_9GAMM|nr:flagellin [Amphritea atlantica]